MTNVEQQKARATLTVVRRLWLTCGIVSAAALAVAGVLTVVDPADVNWVVWLRGSVVAVASFVFIAVTVAAARGSVRAYRRLRWVSIIAPIGIALIIVAPDNGYPLWMKAEQGVVGVIIAVIGVLLHRAVVRQSFGSTR